MNQMKKLGEVALFLSLCGCIAHKQPTQEADEGCPKNMSVDVYTSGVVQCRALCSSYGRDMVSFELDCRCICAGAHQRANDDRVHQM